MVHVFWWSDIAYIIALLIGILMFILWIVLMIKLPRRKIQTPGCRHIADNAAK